MVTNILVFLVGLFNKFSLIINIMFNKFALLFWYILCFLRVYTAKCPRFCSDFYFLTNYNLI